MALLRAIRVAALLLTVVAAAGCHGSMSGSAWVEIRAQPAIVAPGEPTTLSWSTSKVTGCRASGSWTGPRPLSGTLAATPGNSAAVFRLSCAGADGVVTSEIRVTVPEETRLVFPLHAVTGQRYLSDAEGRPVLLQGDAAWSLIAATRRDDVDRYLDDRRARGFNAVIVNLVEHKFAVNAPANAYGIAPFRIPGDFSTPDDAYFEYADWVIGSAERRQIAVFLAPGYLGYGGGDEGWYRELAASSPEKLRAYGAYVGERFRTHHNIVWVFGGDYNPPNRMVVTQLAAGVAATAPFGLGTAHCAPESAASDVWKGEPWLTLNTAYTYRPVAAVAESLLHSSRLPLVLIESRYEGEPGGSAQRARVQAYQALLTGTGGQFFGMSPLWHFNGPGNFPSPLRWEQGLASEGSVSMTQLGRIMRSRRWWLLEPDTGGSLLHKGIGMGYQRATAAIARDGSFALLYLPSPRRVTLRLSKLMGPTIEARWFEPGTGAMSSTVEFAKSPNAVIDLPARSVNAHGADDRLLLLTSR